MQKAGEIRWLLCCIFFDKLIMQCVDETIIIKLTEHGAGQLSTRYNNPITVSLLINRFAQVDPLLLMLRNNIQVNHKLRTIKFMTY